jgi:hypothetical protein
MSRNALTVLHSAAEWATMSRPVRWLTLVGLLLAHNYPQSPGYDYSSGGHFLAYGCMRHFAPMVAGVMPGPRCPCGEPLVGGLLVRLSCDCGTNLYYPANDPPTAVRHVRGGHRPKPTEEER